MSRSRLELSNPRPASAWPASPIHRRQLRAPTAIGPNNCRQTNLTLHPATGVRALFDEAIDMTVGVPQSYFIDQFAGEGIMFEGAAGPPDYMAMSLPASGPEHRELMLRYRNLSQFGILVSDHDSRGFVRERFGIAAIRYDLGRRDVQTFKRAIELMCECYWAAGATVVYPPIERVGELRDGDTEPLRRLDLRPQDLTLIAFHPLGTARTDARPGHGVVDADLAYHLLDKGPPDQEPEPPSIARVSAVGAGRRS